MSKKKGINPFVEYILEHLFVIYGIFFLSSAYLLYYTCYLLVKKIERWQHDIIAAVCLAFLAGILCTKIGRKSLKAGASFAKEFFG